MWISTRTWGLQVLPRTEQGARRQLLSSGNSSLQAPFSWQERSPEKRPQCFEVSAESSAKAPWQKNRGKRLPIECSFLTKSLRASSSWPGKGNHSLLPAAQHRSCAPLSCARGGKPRAGAVWVQGRAAPPFCWEGRGSLVSSAEIPGGWILTP